MGGPLGAGLAAVARNNFEMGTRAALSAAIGVTGAGVLLVLAVLPSRSRETR